MKNIVFAPLHRRFFAALIDLLLFLFFALGVFAILESIFAVTPWYQGAKDATDSLREASMLYVYNEEEESWTSPSDPDSYLVYQDLITSFYEEGVEAASPSLIPNREGQTFAYWYNVHLLGLEDYKNIYGYLELSYPATDGEKYFQWAKLPSGEMDENSIAIPADDLYLAGSAYDENGNLRPLENLKEDARADLMRFYYDESGANSSLYYQVMEQFTQSEPYRSTLREEEAIRRAYPLAISLAITYPVLYLVLPLCFANGATFGKKMLKVALTNKLGYKVSKGQLVMRALPFYFLAIILILFVPNLWASYAVLLGLLLLSYVLSIFTHSHLAIHDYLAATVVVDLRSSTIYSSILEEEEANLLIEKAREEAEKMKEKGEMQLEEERKKEG